MRTKVILAAAALLSTSLPVFAADLMIEEPAPAVSSGYDWSGAYVGGFAGYAGGTADWTGDFYNGATLLDSESGSFTVDGWLLGGTVGANMQSGAFVFGLEGDIAWANISGEGVAIDPNDATPSIPSAAIDYLGTLRVRAGVAADSVLIYATGGLAFAGGNITITNLDGAGDDRTEDFTASGWAAGVGAELALADNVSVKAEYLYTSLSTDDVNFGAAAPATDVIVSSDVVAHTVKVGVNYGF